MLLYTVFCRGPNSWFELFLTLVKRFAKFFDECHQLRGIIFGCGFGGKFLPTLRVTGSVAVHNPPPQSKKLLLD